VVMPLNCAKHLWHSHCYQSWIPLMTQKSGGIINKTRDRLAELLIVD
jgi:hypothetical protein